MTTETNLVSKVEGNVPENMPVANITVTLVDLGGRTKLVSRTEYATAEEVKQIVDMGAIAGISQTWDNLEEHLGEMA